MLTGSRVRFITCLIFLSSLRLRPNVYRKAILTHRMTELHQFRKKQQTTSTGAFDGCGEGRVLKCGSTISRMLISTICCALSAETYFDWYRQTNSRYSSATYIFSSIDISSARVFHRRSPSKIANWRLGIRNANVLGHVFLDASRPPSHGAARGLHSLSRRPRTRERATLQRKKRSREDESERKTRHFVRILDRNVRSWIIFAYERKECGGVEADKSSIGQNSSGS